MLPMLVAGLVFGVGTAIGQKYGESVIIPAAKEAFADFKAELKEFSDKCKEERDKAAEDA